MTKNKKRVIVIGGGLTGLSAAMACQQHADIEVTLLEASAHVGGVIQSEWVTGQQPHQRYLVENGPHTFQPSGKALLALCDELGLTPLASSPVAKDRFVWWQDALQPVPMSPLAFINTKLLTPLGKCRLLAEPFRPKTPHGATVTEWVTNRLGHEALTTMVGPFLSGVYAGNPDTLIAQYVFRRLVRLEEAWGSVVCGGLMKGGATLLNKLAGKRAGKPAAPPPQRQAPKQPYALMNFAEGMAALPQAMGAALNAHGSELRLNTAVAHIEKRDDGGWHVHCQNGDTLIADGLCITTPTYITSQLLAGVDGTFAQTLATVPYAPMVVAHVAFNKGDIAQPLDGFGFLVPRQTGKRLLGSIWVSSLYESRCPDDELLLTVFIGGAMDPDAVNLTDDELREVILAELPSMMGVSTQAKPTLWHVQRWRQAIPQYTQGHGKVLLALEAFHHQHPTCRLAGNFTQGVAMNDCVLHGQASAASIINAI